MSNWIGGRGGPYILPHPGAPVTGSSHQARIDEFFTRRPTIGVNRDNAHYECSHCGGVYHSPTQCPVIITQVFNYVLCIKAAPILIPLKPKEGAPTSSQYPECTIKPLPWRAREPRPVVIWHLEPGGQDLCWCTGVSVGTSPLCLTLVSCLIIVSPP